MTFRSSYVLRDAALSLPRQSRFATSTLKILTSTIGSGTQPFPQNAAPSKSSEPKIGKLDDLTFPDRGGKRRTVNSPLSSSLPPQPLLAEVCDVSAFLDSLLPFLNWARLNNQLQNVVGFKIDHSQGYRHITLSSLLPACHCFKYGGQACMNLVMPFGARPFAGI